jgi:hypothetical protein
VNYSDFQQTETFILLRRAICRERNQKFCVGSLLLLLGVWALSRLTWRADNWLLGVLALALLVGGLLIVTYLLRHWKPEQQEPLRTLRIAPQQIVWIYGIETDLLPFGVKVKDDCTLYFWLVNRDFITVKLPKSKRNTASEQLHAYLPRVTFGYSQEREQWYIANPELLFRD